MNRPNNGGPAFPTVESDDYVTDMGMSLRDWFAGQALAGLVAFDRYEERPEVLAGDAYLLADAMLSEREPENASEAKPEPCPHCGAHRQEKCKQCSEVVAIGLHERLAEGWQHSSTCWGDMPRISGCMSLPVLDGTFAAMNHIIIKDEAIELFLRLGRWIREQESSP